MQCKTERGGSVGLKHKILQPLGVTKFSLKENKKRVESWKLKNAIKWEQSQTCLSYAERKHFGRKSKLKIKDEKTGEGNDIAGMEALYPDRRGS